MELNNLSLNGNVVAKQVAPREGYGDAQINFLTTAVSEFKESPYRRFMDTAWSYYRNENDICRVKRYVIGRDTDNNPYLKESNVLSNNKLSHNFMKKLTRQKIGYMLGKPFVMEETKKDDSLAEKYIEECQNYFDETFFKRLKNVARDSIVCGMGWLQVYYDEEGNLCYRRCAPEEIIPFWKDNDHTELDAVVRFFTIEHYDAKGGKVGTNYLEYYVPEGIYYYKENESGKYIPDPERLGLFPHFKGIITRNGTQVEEQFVWGKIPFIPFKYDADEQSLLARIKSLVDDYDRKTSDIANNIDDFPNSLLMIKNYDGESKEDFIATLNDYRAVFVQGDGDAKPLQIPMDFEGIATHLERLRQDIYEFGQGVNTADKDIRDTSGVALRFIYADLDMDCIDWGQEVKWSIQQLMWFIQNDMRMKGKGDYTGVRYNITFNTDVIINETETIANCMNSKNVISKETIANNHPWTLNAKKEVEDLYADTEEDLALQAKYNTKATTTNGGSTTSTTNTKKQPKSATYGTEAYKAQHHNGVSTSH